jgi:hypothetical protein
MNCTEFQNELPDLILTPNAKPSVAAAAHLAICPPCTEEYLSFQRTFAVMDAWKAPDPSPYFDQKMRVRLREEIAAPKMGWLESLMTRIELNTGRQFRPAMAGVLALALIAGGGSFAGLKYTSSTPKPTEASATVEDLQILDKNEQAFEQLDELQQDEDASPQPNDTAAASAQPTS